MYDVNIFYIWENKLYYIELEEFVLKFYVLSDLLQYADNCLYTIQGEAKEWKRKGKKGKYLFWNLLIDLQSIGHKPHPSETILGESVGLCLAQ